MGVRKEVNHMFSHKKAATGAEVGLLIGLISVLLIGSISSLGTSLKEIFSQTEATLNDAHSQAPKITVSGDLVGLMQAPSVAKSFTLKQTTPSAQVTATSSNSSVISNSALSINQGAVTIDLSAASLGATTITLTASNSFGSDTTQFTLTIENPQNCLALAEAGVTASGTYTLDPDGSEGGIEPLNLTCDMAYTALGNGYQSTGWTVLNNNRESLSADTSCGGDNCKVFDVTYSDDDGQTLPTATINALTAQATHIAQDFYKSCYASLISVEYDGGTAAAVVFVKVGSSTKVPVSRSAHLNGVIPNCDANDNAWRSDSFTLVDTTDILPIASLWGGDSDDAGEVAYYQIGKLYLQ